MTTHTVVRRVPDGHGGLVTRHFTVRAISGPVAKRMVDDALANRLPRQPLAYRPVIRRAR